MSSAPRSRNPWRSIPQAALEGLESRLLLAPHILLQLTTTNVSEGTGVAAITATVTRGDPPSLTSSLTVALSADDADELAFPATVTIPANQASTTFTIDTINDALIDGTANVTFTAAAVNFDPGAQFITVTDDDSVGTTIIGGRQTGSLPAGTYGVSHSLVVPTGQSLTLAPATTLQFSAGESFDVSGRLLAQANSVNPIMFVSESGSPAPGDWTGLRFLGSFSQPRSFLESVTISHATTGVLIDGDEPLVTIAASDIGFSSQNGMFIDDDSAASDVIVAASRIHDNALHGVRLSATASGCTGAFASITLTGNELDHNGASGVHMGAQASFGCLIGPGGATVSSILSGNRIHHNTNGVTASIADSDNRASTTRARLENNFISENLVDGVNFQSDSTDNRFEPEIVNNTIVRNGNSGIVLDPFTDVGMRVFNNIVAGNAFGLVTEAGYTHLAGTIGFNAVADNLGGNFLNYPAEFGDLTTTNANGTPSDVYFNLTAPPCFEPDELHVPVGCPVVVAAGTNTGVIAPTTDFDGDLRDAPPDIGADEVHKLQITLGPIGAATDTSTVVPGLFQIREGAPGGAATAIVKRTTGDLSADLVVSIVNPDPTQFNLPATVTILAGDATATFSVDTVDDSAIEADADFTINVTAPETRADATQPIRLIDDERLPAQVQGASEHRINQNNLANTDRDADVAWLSNTEYVVVWRTTQSGGSTQIVAQKFDIADQPVGGEITIVTLPSGIISQTPRVDAAGGNFVVAWSRTPANQATREVVSRRFDASGSPLTDEVVVVGGSTTHLLTDVAAFADGRWAVIYTDTIQNQLLAQEYNADGTSKGAEELLADSPVNPDLGSLTYDAAGNLIAVWGQLGTAASRGVVGKRFDAVAGVWSANIPISLPGSSSITGVRPSVSAASDGSFAVAWIRIVSGVNTLRARRMAADGAPLTDEFQASALAPADGGKLLSVASQASGDFTIAFSSNSDVYTRQFFHTGLPKGAEPALQTSTGTQSVPRLALAPDDRHFVVAWEGNGPGDSGGVFARRLLTTDPALAVTFAAPSVIENGGSIVGTVTRSGVNTAAELTVNLASNDASELTVPATVTIPAGLASVEFTATIINDTLDDGPQNVAVTPTAPQYASTAGPLTVVDDELVLTNLPPTQNYSENAAPRALAPNALVANAGTPDFDGGALTVTIVSGKSAADRLDVRDVGTAAGQIGFDGTTVTFGGVPIGTRTTSAPLVVTFNAAATQAAVQALVRAITFRVESDNPTTAVRQIRFQVADGDGGVSPLRTVACSVTRSNDAPVLSAITSPQAYTENAAPKLIATTALVADPDAVHFNNGGLTVTFPTAFMAGDRLSIRSQNTQPNQIRVFGDVVAYNNVAFGAITSDGVGGRPLVVEFDSTAATLPAVRALIRNIEFSHTSDNPTNFGNTPSRTVRYVLDDGAGGVSPAVDQTLNITASNDRPVLGAILPQTYKENGAAKLLAPLATVADPDSANFDAGKLTVKYTAGGLGSDRLTIRHQGTGPGQVGVSGNTLSVGGVVVGTFAGGTGLQALVVTFNADAKPLRVQAVLRTIQYQNVSDNPTNFGANPSRTVNYLLTDGDGGTSLAVNQTLDITAVNDATLVGNFTDASTYTAGAGATILDANATLADPDSADFTGGNLVLMFSAGSVATNRLAIRNQGTGANQIGVNGIDVTFAGTVIGTLNANGGVGLNALIVTFTPAATPAAVQALIRNLTYQSTAASPTGPKTLTLKVRDGDGGLTTVNKTLNIAPALVAAPRSSAAFASYAEWENAL